ncbi:hypothetical protein HMPREF1549_01562 [Actinomyces johnsonii F0510]|uniref:Uncharacterized protein n=1 Tax=Actinomyces johnsonii F0510 TaxID=1227262 RepID=U1Q9M2_9ACTO|nr:hypothetical protein HMPREF1549_01562 [Actinomyces johnsonii F0510]
MEATTRGFRCCDGITGAELRGYRRLRDSRITLQVSDEFQRRWMGPGS